CYAALAGCGTGVDAPAEDGRAALRRRALAWLRADLTLRRTQWAEGGAGRMEADLALRQWLRDTDFAGVRDPDGLAKLPDPERQAWEALWRDARATLERPPA
ncbi:MAG: hypothetical protein K2X91_14795, partial [Thermoleophilia bacterium]|nr:hypothetical protein [Thermoleophilia bacterium]